MSRIQGKLPAFRGACPRQGRVETIVTIKKAPIGKVKFRGKKETKTNTQKWSRYTQILNQDMTLGSVKEIPQNKQEILTPNS